MAKRVNKLGANNKSVRNQTLAPGGQRKSKNRLSRNAQHRTALRLVTRKSLTLGRPKIASSSDGILDYAVAVHQRAIPNAGLPALLYTNLRARATRLSKANAVTRIKLKTATVQNRHSTTELRRLAVAALATVLGPAYQAEYPNAAPKELLDTQAFIPWVRGNLANVTSSLCMQLVGTKYEDLIGLRRSARWWRDCIWK